MNQISAHVITCPGRLGDESFRALEPCHAWDWSARGCIRRGDCGCDESLRAGRDG